MIGIWNYLIVGALVFVLGVMGIFLNRKNVIVILMSIELILLAVNLNFVAFSAAQNDLAGQVMAMLVLTVAAAEAAIAGPLTDDVAVNRSLKEMIKVYLTDPSRPDD